MDTTVPTTRPIHSISKNKESHDDISYNNTVIDTLAASSPSLLSSYKETSVFCTHHTYFDCQSITGKIGTDKTCQLLVPSVSGNNYLLIIFYHDSNSIFAKTIPTAINTISKMPMPT